MFHVKQLNFLSHLSIFLFFFLLLHISGYAEELGNANELYFQGEPEKAVEVYLKKIEEEPANINYWVNLALTYRDLALYPEAIASLKHASYAYPPGGDNTVSKEEILNLLAWFYYYSGRIEEAEDTFSQVLKSTNSLINLTALAVGDPAVAVGSPKSSIFNSSFGLGRINIEKKNWLEAEKIFKSIVTANPDFALGYYFLGAIYENLNRLEEANQMYQQTLKTDSKLVETYSSLGRIYEKQNNYEQADKQYQKILDIDPLNIEAKKKKEGITPLLARKPEETERKNRISNFSKISPAKERAKIPLLRIGTGSDEKGAPYPTEKISLRTNDKFLVLKKKKEEIILKGVSSFQINAKEGGKAQILVSTSGSGEYDEAIIVRLINPATGTIVVEEVPYGKSFAWATNEDREYRGEFEIIPDKKYGLISINIINLGEYLYSVLPSEMYSAAPKEALKAQAVVARSVTLFKQRYSKPHKNFGYDLCDEQHCQVYRGVKMENDKAKQSASETRGEILVCEDKVINAIFHANCGGYGQSAKELKGWGDEAYLTGVFDGEKTLGQTTTINSPWELEKWIRNKPAVYCDFVAENFQPTKFRWVRITPAKDIEERVNREYTIGRIIKIIPLKRSKSGHLQKLKIVGEKGETILDKEYEIRKILGLGFLRSTLLVI
ncbi:MAG TPA: hypothetical protein DHV62_08375, partial [Elusimicrobia bacterium]|nr:hypothetical protein [Elusimicrobiota bacterium]